MAFDYSFSNTWPGSIWEKTGDYTYTAEVSVSCENNKKFISDNIINFKYSWFQGTDIGEMSILYKYYSNYILTLGLLLIKTIPDNIPSCTLSGDIKDGIDNMEDVFDFYKGENDTEIFKLSGLYENSSDKYNQRIWGDALNWAQNCDCYKSTYDELSRRLYLTSYDWDPTKSFTMPWLANAGSVKLPYTIETIIDDKSVVYPLTAIEKGCMPRPFNATCPDENTGVIDSYDYSIQIGTFIQEGDENSYITLFRGKVYYKENNEITEEEAIVVYSADDKGDRLTNGAFQNAYTARNIASESTYAVYLSINDASSSKNKLTAKNIFKEDSNNPRTLSSGVPYVFSAMICGGGQAGQNDLGATEGGKGGNGSSSAYIILNFKELNNTAFTIQLGCYGKTNLSAGGNSIIYYKDKEADKLQALLAIRGGGKADKDFYFSSNKVYKFLSNEIYAYILSSSSGGQGGAGRQGSTHGEQGNTANPSIIIKQLIYDKTQSIFTLGTPGSGGSIPSGTHITDGGTGGGGGTSIGKGGKGGMVYTYYQGKVQKINYNEPTCGYLGSGGGGGSGGLGNSAARNGATGGRGAIILFY